MARSETLSRLTSSPSPSYGSDRRFVTPFSTALRPICGISPTWNWVPGIRRRRRRHRQPILSPFTYPSYNRVKALTSSIGQVLADFGLRLGPRSRRGRIGLLIRRGGIKHLFPIDPHRTRPPTRLATVSQKWPRATNLCPCQMPPYGMLPNPLLRGLHVTGGRISRQSLYDLTYSSVTVGRARTTVTLL